MVVTIEDGLLTKATGDKENPLYLGYSCPKGRALPELHNNPARLLHSQKRGPSGSFSPISSTTAMDEVAERVQALIERHGPRSIALYVGTNALPYALTGGFANAWMREIGSPMFFTSNTIDQPGKQIAVALHGGWQAGEQHFDEADTWMMVGSNPIISKSAGIPTQDPIRRLNDALERGLKLIVIDPRRTETAQRAHVHLQPRPGEDPTLLAGISNIIITEGLHDTSFVDTETEGFDEFAKAVARFTPDYVAERADVPKQDLLEAARTFGGALTGGCTLGTGPNFATHGNLSEYLSLCLNTICGRWARAGEPVLRPNALLPAYTARAQPYPTYQAWGKGEQLRVRGLTDTAAGMPTAALADEILLPGDGQVKALFCVGGNPLMAFPDQRKTYEAMQALDLLVTFDTEMSATSQLADYVIAPRMTLETPGMTQPAEMLKYFGHSVGYTAAYAQYSDKVVDPPADSDVIEEWEFFYGLCKRMQLTPTLVGFYGWKRHVESPLRIFPIDMETKPTSEELHALLCEGSRIPLDEVKRHPHGMIFDDETPVVEPRDSDCELRLQLANEYMIRELDDVRQASSTWDPSSYRYRLVSRRSYHVLNSTGRSIDRLTRKRSHNPAFMHPDDLAALGLSNGDAVTVTSPHDSIPALVESDPTLRPGVISMTHAFGGLPTDVDDDRFREIGSNTGRLIPDDVEYDPVTGIPRMGAIPVAITRHPTTESAV